MSRKNFVAAAGLFVLTCGAGCMQPVNTGSTAGGGARDPNATPSTVIEPSQLPIGTDITDEAKTTDDPCVKTRADKTEILKAYCASCHSGPTAFGLPKFDFVLDDAALISREWIREGQPAQRFVIPGDPSNSVLYTRVAVIGDMPAQPSDLATPRNPAPSLSDIGILYEWIAHCAGPAMTPPGGAGGASGSGGAGGGDDDGGDDVRGTGGSGAGGTGGSTVAGTGGRGTGGSVGAGGAGGAPVAGSDGGVATDGGATADGGVVADGGAGPAACAANVNNGGVCGGGGGGGAQTCRLGAQTCTCSMAGQGMRRWVCR